ncbi:MAG: energy transducer TonB [Salinibacter sp.]
MRRVGVARERTGERNRRPELPIGPSDGSGDAARSPLGARTVPVCLPTDGLFGGRGTFHRISCIERYIRPRHLPPRVMRREYPFYRRSSASVLGRYSVSLLFGWTASLGTLVLLLHLPLTMTQPRVGWSLDRDTERIALSEVRRPTETGDDGAETGPSSAPPPTQHSVPPAPKPAAGPSDGEDSSGDGGSPDSSTTTPTVRHVSSLTRSDRRPEILGGRGLLSLHLEYPAAARRQGIEGKMKVQFTVDTDGKARNIVVSKSLHPLCDSAAVDAIRAVRFRPGTYQGQPIPVRMSLPIRFKLQPTGEPPLPGQSAGDTSG